MWAEFCSLSAAERWKRLYHAGEPNVRVLEGKCTPEIYKAGRIVSYRPSWLCEETQDEYREVSARSVLEYNRACAQYEEKRSAARRKRLKHDLENKRVKLELSILREQQSGISKDDYETLTKKLD